MTRDETTRDENRHDENTKGEYTLHENTEDEGERRRAGRGGEAPLRSKVLKARGYRWEGVPVREYKEGGDHFRGVIRQTLLGEGEGEESLAFITRYFEVEPGGYSSLERHRHPHSVVVVRGRGEVILGDEVHPLRPLDCVYVAPDEVHRFRATGEEPLGFLCVVDRDRDLPRVVDVGSDEEVGSDEREEPSS